MTPHSELVLRLLHEWAGAVPPEGIRPEHHLVRDLHVNGDDYGMSLVPELKKQLGISPKRQEWEISTVAQLLEVVERHVSRKDGGGGASA